MAAKVLVVDDSMIVRKALQKMLGDKVDIISVDSAASARASIVKQRPALIISDVIMPKEDGFSLSRSIKRHAKFKSIPILLMSGVVDEETQQQAKNAGAIGVLKKPFSSDEIQKVVGKIFTQLRKRQQRLTKEQATSEKQQDSEKTDIAKHANVENKTQSPKQLEKQQVQKATPDDATRTIAAQAKETRVPPTTPHKTSSTISSLGPHSISPNKVIFEFSNTQITELNKQLHHVLTSANAGCIWLFSAGVAVTEVGHSHVNAQDLLIPLYLMREAALSAGKELKLDSLQEATFEYGKHTLLIHTVHSRDSESIFIVMLLDENGALSMARYVLGKNMPEIHKIIGYTSA